MIKVIKIISLCFLVAVFVYYVQGRTFSFPQGGPLLSKKTSLSGAQITEPQRAQPGDSESGQKKETLAEQKSSPQERDPVQPDPNLAPPVLLPTTPRTVQAPKKEIAILPNTSPYEVLQKSTSDTDESYRPSISPCKQTMGYRIGTFDSRFGITEKQFIDALKSAEAVWGNATNKALFSYNPQGSLTVNLVYDERQDRTVSIHYLALEIANSKQTAEALKIEYEVEKANYTLEQDLLKNKVENFNTRYKAYEEKVATYNASGGAPQQEYERMMAELSSFKQEAALLDAQKTNLTTFIETINTKVRKYNELVGYINTLIKRSNALSGTTFTEGRFTPSTNTIDIYQFSSTIKLERVLAHEFGHVIGINHTKDANSIMYEENGGESLTLTEDDLSALREVCH